MAMTKGGTSMLKIQSDRITIDGYEPTKEQGGTHEKTQIRRKKYGSN